MLPRSTAREAGLRAPPTPATRSAEESVSEVAPGVGQPALALDPDGDAKPVIGAGFHGAVRGLTPRPASAAGTPQLVGKDDPVRAGAGVGRSRRW